MIIHCLSAEVPDFIFMEKNNNLLRIRSHLNEIIFDNDDYDDYLVLKFQSKKGFTKVSSTSSSLVVKIQCYDISSNTNTTS